MGTLVRPKVFPSWTLKTLVLYVLFSDIMTLYVELDFCQNFLWYTCRTVKTKEASEKCYNFSLISGHPRDPNCVELEPYKILTQPWLYGTATDRKTRTIIYPCERFKCLIPCSCLLCDKKNPSCSSRGNCSCKECKLYMRTSRPKVCHICGLVFCNSGTLGTHMIMEHSKNKRWKESGAEPSCVKLLKIFGHLSV